MSIAKKFIYENYIHNEAVLPQQQRPPGLLQRAGNAITSGLGASEKFLSNNASTLNTAMAFGAPGMAIGAATGITQFISQKMMEHKWKSKGCDQEVDPNRKAQCEVRMRNVTIANLSKEKPSCNRSKDPQDCIQKIDEKINMLRQQNTEAYQ